MRKLSEYKDGEAPDLLADLLEPATEILADEEVGEALREGKRMTAIKAVMKRHKPQVMAILAAMEGVPAEDYHCNVLTVPMRLIEILNDRDLLAVFTSQAQEMMSATSSGPVMESIEGGAQ